MYRIYFLLFIFFSLNPCCKSQTLEKNKIYFDEFYSVLNELVHTRFANASVITSETHPVYRTMWGNSKVPDSLHPTPPPPWIIYYNLQTFDNLIENKIIDSTDAKFMYKSIDSTIVFKIDSTRVTIPTISSNQLVGIFKTYGMIEGDKVLKKKYGNSFILSLSSPIFNSTFTKVLMSINFKNNLVDAEHYRLLLEKKDAKWRIIEDKR